MAETITTRDGVKLAYTKTGSGHPLILVPGWSQSAAEWGRQIEALSKVATCYAVDMRGHGLSDKPDHGYRISTLAADLADFIAALGLKNVDLMGHSMGCSIIWAYIDQYGQGNIRKLVLVDEAPAVVGRPDWTPEQSLEAGVFLPNYEALYGFCGAVVATTEAVANKEILRGMFTDRIPEDDLLWVSKENLALPRPHAATLLHDHCLNDWRDVIRTIRKPTLVVGGEKSFFSTASQRWIAAQIPGAEVSIFPGDEGGSHFMFFENPTRFNAEVSAFLAG